MKKRIWGFLAACMAVLIAFATFSHSFLVATADEISDLADYAQASDEVQTIDQELEAAVDPATESEAESEVSAEAQAELMTENIAYEDTVGDSSIAADEAVEVLAGEPSGEAATETADDSVSNLITVTYLAGEGGSVSLTSECTDSSNASYQGSTAVAGEGYSFSNWTVNEECVSTEPYLNPADYANVSDNIVFTANFAPMAADTASFPAVDFGTQTVGSTGISIKAPQGAFPAGVKVVINPVSAACVVDNVNDAMTGTEVAQSDILAFDISFYVNDITEDLQPRLPISVEFSNVDLSGDSLEIYHMKDENSEATKLAESSNDGYIEVNNATDFSIYVIAAPDIVTDEEGNEYYLLTYNFYNAEGSKLLSSQTLKAPVEGEGAGTTLEMLYEPVVDEIEGYKFLGWAGTAKADTATESFTFDQQITGVTAGGTVNVYAVYAEVHYVFFMDRADDNGEYNRVLVTKEGKKGDVISTSDVNVIMSSVEGLVGWCLDTDLTKKVNEVTIADRDIRLYPNVGMGHYLYFDAGEEGSYTEPMFVAVGDVTVKPGKTPVRQGYEFVEWTVTEGGAAFEFGKALTADTTVYAKWKPVLVKYTVVYWQQNIDDDKDLEETDRTYDYKESVTRYALTGSEISIEEADKELDYHGFHFGHVGIQGDMASDTTAKADGTSVINVCYDRDYMTVAFKYVDYGTDTKYVYKDYYTIGENGYFTGLYGQKLSKYGYNWPGSTAFQFCTFTEAKPNSYKVGRILNYLDAFLFDDFILDQEYSKGDGQQLLPVYWNQRAAECEVRFYTENLDGDWDVFQTFNIGKKNTFDLTDKFTGFALYDYAFIDKNGFDDKFENADWKSATANTRLNHGKTGQVLAVRYKRLSYDFVYYNYNGEELVVPVKYEDNILSALKAADAYDFEVSHPAEVPVHYEFTGWYKDKTCKVPFDFDYNMPANNVLAFAKWEGLKQCKLIAHVAMEDDSDYYSYDVPYGEAFESGRLPSVNNGEKSFSALEESAQEAITIPSGYSFVGWTEKDADGNYIIYNFNTRLYEDKELFPYYINKENHMVIYDPNGGMGNVSDTVLYAEGSAADVKDGSVLTPPAGKVGFTGWNTAADGSGKSYFANDKVEFVKENYNDGSNIRLYAMYADAGLPTSLTYHANNGSGKTHTVDLANNKTVTISTVGKLGFKYPGYTFVEWNTKPDRSGIAYKGDILLDNLTENDLYAIWVKKTVPVNPPVNPPVDPPVTPPTIPSERPGITVLGATDGPAVLGIFRSAEDGEVLGVRGRNTGDNFSLLASLTVIVIAALGIAFLLIRKKTK
ncbi:InlB B-repeat-containing protein [Butyrivibrio sp. MC2013]|uniref:InlB B-repeat-containing protein n=1 Tax=Butyrivibrio sp. MC2013 TaxID=1280686 RepID=UPI00040CB7D9|nr:InlB B-repeat-containing protein [Butyrivibrio sp. MC2013]